MHKLLHLKAVCYKFFLLYLKRCLIVVFI